MRKLGLIGLALAVPGGIAATGAARAADAVGSKAAIDCHAKDAPYKKYDCLDAYLGDGFFERMINYYKLEWGHEGPPADPKAPPARRAGWPDAPATTPPFPFTEWPYGGATSIGVTRPSSADSPLMVAMANTTVGKTLNDNNMQIYGWINGGGNISTNTTKPGGNWPASYDFSPNRFQLDQAVLYFERLPDTVQTDHVDWGFRMSAIYGENYRYTTAYGLASYQLLGHNLYNGYDFPMMYGELYVPQIAEGMLVRVGRYISVPDIEAQLAPNNYMYSHSMTYTFDNYTNTGIQTTTALNKNWFVQLGVTVGTEAMPWHWGQTIPNPFPNPVFPGNTMLKDPGAKPSVTAGVRWQSDNGWDNIYVVADAINDGTWGYNNLQWKGVTWYHRINEQWHFSWEMYSLSQNNVLNANNKTCTLAGTNCATGVFDVATIVANGGFPFSTQAGLPFNSPNLAQCSNPNVLTCKAEVFTTVMYLNYQFSPLDNISFRPEFYDDMEGQRTGTKTRYVDFGIGWQHWFSPQVEIRPEVTYYRSLDAPAFNGNFNGGIAPNKHDALVGAADLIWHF
jgi:hypothetical protein